MVSNDTGGWTWRWPSSSWTLICQDAWSIARSRARISFKIGKFEYSVRNDFKRSCTGNYKFQTEVRVPDRYLNLEIQSIQKSRIMRASKNIRELTMNTTPKKKSSWEEFCLGFCHTRALKLNIRTVAGTIYKSMRRNTTKYERNTTKCFPEIRHSKYRPVWNLRKNVFKITDPTC